MGEYYCDFNGVHLCLKLVYDSGESEYVENHYLELSIWAYWRDNDEPGRKLYFSVLTAISKYMQVCLYWKFFHHQPGGKAAIWEANCKMQAA